MDGVVCPIYKKGDKLDCCNFRGITLINAAYKVLCRRLSPLVIIFIDFKAAYDTVDREQLWQGMHEYGFSDKLTRLIAATMHRVMCYVRVSGVLADIFLSHRELRRGDGLLVRLLTSHWR